MDDIKVYINTIKEVLVEDNGLSWKYIITDNEDEGILIEYWEIDLKTKIWKKESDFKLDTFCAKSVLESALKLISDNK